MANTEVKFKPLYDESGIKKHPPTTQQTAAWLRQLADDIENKRINSFSLQMDCWGEIQGTVGVIIPDNYLKIW